MKSFEDTDPRPYDRHRYRVQFRDGSYMDIGSYAEATDLWYSSLIKPQVIVVLPATKSSRPRGGFG